MNLTFCFGVVWLTVRVISETGSTFKTVIPQARMGSESIAHEAEGRAAPALPITGLSQ